jgi:hypothetical protein
MPPRTDDGVIARPSVSLHALAFTVATLPRQVLPTHKPAANTNLWRGVRVIFRNVSARKDDGSGAAVALSAGLLGTGEPDTRRAQVVDEQQVGRRVFDSGRFTVEVESYVINYRHKCRTSANAATLV